MAEDSDVIVRLEKVTKSYGAAQSVFALDKIDLQIKRGEQIAVMGPSGSGKSTLLNILCGLDALDAGKITFDGADLANLNDDGLTRLRREKIGMIFQTFNLLPTLTALENVSLPLRLNGERRRTADEKAAAMIEQVNLKNRITHRPDELSGGERQRVAIARALIFNPPLLLADEPTGNLDSNTGEEILNLLGKLHREFKTTIVLVTHDAQAAEHCERKITLRDGHIVSDENSSKKISNVMTGRI